MPNLIDTHCHLNLGELALDPDRYRRQARDAGVEAMVVIGTNAESSLAAVELAQRLDGVWAAVGVHPNETARASDGFLQEIAALLERDRVVAVGETGIDLYWKDSPVELQERWLDDHAELALAADRPLVLHIRDAYPRAAARLAPFARRGLRAVIHCFGGEEREVDPFLDWGWPISWSGILTYPKAENVRAAARRTPLEQCLVETDSPWLAPLSRRGALCEPAFVVETARRLAEVKDVGFDEIAAVTTANARAFFRLPVTEPALEPEKKTP